MARTPEVIPSACGKYSYFTRTGVVQGRCRFYGAARSSASASLAGPEDKLGTLRPVRSLAELQSRTQRTLRARERARLCRARSQVGHQHIGGALAPQHRAGPLHTA